MHDPIYKILGSFMIGGLATIVESLQAFDGAIQTLGLPILGCGAFGYAIVKLYKTILRLVEEKMRDADTRLEESKQYADKLAIHVEKGSEARAKLIQLSEKSLELNAEQLKAQAKMAIALDKLSEAIKSRPCQK